MNYLQKFNETINYIEEHIDSNIDVASIETISFTSYHHFNRMFTILSGMSLKEYIRKRRLSKAAHEIISSDCKIIDLAYKYQYQTPESFSKAFKNFHHITPSEVRKNKGPVKTIPKLSFQLTIQGGNEMKFEVIQKKDLTFVGYSIDVTTEDGKNFELIPKFWQDIMKDGRFQVLLANVDQEGIVGICYDWNMEANTFKYMIGIRDHNQDLKELEHVAFPDDTFASFEAKGSLPNSIQSTTKYIYSEWFPQSGYEHSAGPELEIYLGGDSNSDDYICYYLVPIRKKTI